MACCGGKNKRPETRGALRVRWNGPRGLQAHGSVTGKIYRFYGPGSIVIVDPRDKGMVDSINGLEVYTG